MCTDNPISVFSILSIYQRYLIIIELSVIEDLKSHVQLKIVFSPIIIQINFSLHTYSLAISLKVSAITVVPALEVDL